MAKAFQWKSPLIFAGSLLWSSASWGIRYFSKTAVSWKVRVISVGNLQAGGAGKTPIVAQIAREALARKLRVCILIRGYRSLWEKKGGRIQPHAPLCDPRLCGDEAALLQGLLPEVWIGVGSNRIAVFEELQKGLEKPMDLVILDDGFQYRKIKKDLECVLVTSMTPWQCLYRDFFFRLSEADLMIWTKGEVPPRGWERWPQKRIQMTMKLPHPLEPKLTYWLVTGVADGDAVKVLAQQSGYCISKHWKYPDHYSYDLAQVQELQKKAQHQGVGLLLTGKDQVKWQALGVSLDDVVTLEPQFAFQSGQSLWQKTLWAK